MISHAENWKYSTKVKGKSAPRSAQEDQKDRQETVSGERSVPEWTFHW